MEERNKLILLYDYYKELLNDSQKEYFEAYYFDNLSLAEIAEKSNVSRNAVHKQIKSSIEKLEFFEEKLNIINKHNEIKKELEKIRDENIKQRITEIIES
ncbi:MAG: hypothetical protein IJ105_01440 [Bacilli bacterium]|nr:hypothetical protein [Bacilli bacterium]